MLLTFKNDKFVLYGSGAEYKMLTSFTSERDEWSKIKPGKYSTTSLRAAAQFRSSSDNIAEKVFKRACGQKYSAPLLPPLPYLDKHQIEGIEFILSRSRSYLAHPPGAGKTAQLIIASLLSKGEGATVFIVPPTLTVNWEREIMAWTEHFDIWPSISIVPETAAQNNIAWRSDFIIVPDSMLTKPWVLKPLQQIKKKFVAVDEASRIKDHEAQRTVAVLGGEFGPKNNRQHSIGLVYDSRHAVLADGSPMPNRPMELWAPIYKMSPETINFMSRQDFGMRYCGPTVNDRGNFEFKGSSNEDELNKRLRKDFMHVVDESVLGHPERLRSLVFMNQDPRTAKMKAWEQKHIGKFKFSDIDENMNKGDIASYRRELGLAKIPWTAKYIRERLETKRESIIVFGWHRDVVEGLREEIGNKERPFFTVLGGTKESVRENIFRRFNNGECHIIGNIATMGRGHNLQRGDRGIFIEPSWTDELNKQCEKRMSRRGRDKNKPVRSDYIVAPCTMDEPLMNGLFRKIKSVQKIIR